MCGHKKYKELIEPLVSYTCDKFKDITLQKIGAVRLVYEIMREAIADLHNPKSKKLQRDAEEYFHSDLFAYHCKSVAISRQLMLRIASNPDLYANMAYHQEESHNDEGDFEFSDLS